MNTERAPLFVRLSAPLLTELDARIRDEGRTKQAVVEELLSRQLQTPTQAGDDDVLDLAGVAALLRVSGDDIIDRIVSGDFPGRRFGDEWRFSRAAVTSWLHGTDTVADRHTGFAAS